MNSRGVGTQVKNTLRGRATNMGSKINLLVNEWPLVKHIIWYINGSIFQNSPKFGQNLRTICKNRAILPNIEPICI